MEDLEKLVAGYFEFKKHYSNKFAKLATDGQSPKIMVVACSDSRVDPALVLNSEPGDLFVIRNVANLIPPYQNDSGYHGVSSALEFGVCFLEVRHLIVFGHTHCGGIGSLFASACKITQGKGFLAKWMELARPSYDAVMEHYPHAHMEDKITLCGEESLKHSLENLMTFPWIAKRVNEGMLKLHAWNFELSTGSIKCFCENKKKFSEFSL